MVFGRWMENNEKGAIAVAAIHALTTMIKNSGASTIMELEILLKVFFRICLVVSFIWCAFSQAAQEQLQEMKFEGQR